MPSVASSVRCHGTAAARSSAGTAEPSRPRSQETWAISGAASSPASQASTWSRRSRSICRMRSLVTENRCARSSSVARWEA